VLFAADYLGFDIIQAFCLSLGRFGVLVCFALWWFDDFGNFGCFVFELFSLDFA